VIVEFILSFIFIMKTDYIYIKPFLSIESENNIWYKNLKFLGKGGNGTAFLVLCTSGENMGGIFTLKILHKISDDNRIAKFQREIAYMQEHPHPSIMREYDQGVWEGHPFVVMDHMTTTLETLVQAGEIEL
jgi:serine/threonine-protein kinase